MGRVSITVTVDPSVEPVADTALLVTWMFQVAVDPCVNGAEWLFAIASTGAGSMVTVSDVGSGGRNAAAAQRSLIVGRGGGVVVYVYGNGQSRIAATGSDRVMALAGHGLADRRASPMRIVLKG